MRHLTLWLALALAALVAAWFVLRTRGDASDAAAMPLASLRPDTSAAAAIEASAGSTATESEPAAADPARAAAAVPAPERVQTPFGALEPVRVRGRLVTPQGAPVRDGLVTGLGGSVVQVAADAQGAFEFEARVVADAAVPQTYVYTATAEACSTKNFTATPRAGEACELNDMVLEPGCSLRAIAVDERGAPLADASIRLQPGAGEPAADARYTGPPGGGVEHARTTNAQGVVRLDGLQPGVKRAFLTAAGREWAWSAPLELAPGRTADAGRLVLATRSATSQLALRLVDEQRRGVRAAISVERTFLDTLRLSTDADGRASVDCTPGETLQILCDTSSCLRGPLVVEGLVADGREHELLVAQNPLVALSVVDRSGAPIEGFQAFVQCRFAEKLWAYSSHDCVITGPLQAIPAPPEAFDLTIRADGFRAATRSSPRVGSLAKSSARSISTRANAFPSCASNSMPAAPSRGSCAATRARARTTCRSSLRPATRWCSPPRSTSAATSVSRVCARRRGSSTAGGAGARSDSGPSAKRRLACARAWWSLA